MAALAGAMLLLARNDAAGEILQETWERSYPVGDHATLRVHNTDGRISIYGSEKNEVKVTAVKRSFTPERMRVISVEVAVEGGSAQGGETITVNTNIPVPAKGGITQDRSGTVDYTILVPQNCTVAAAELANGEILIEGLRGPSVRASAGTGRMLVRDCFTRLQLSVDRGGLDVFYSWWEESPVSLQAEIRDGDLRVGLPQDASLQLTAQTASGQIRNRFVEGEKGEDGRELSTVLGAGGETELHLRTGSGNIRIDKF